ncbi:uncharacterized protein [Drosophila tropicalis]|uniref:uncharacterized protein n=1 Tax=Drosophila tropicalis TaxID=46794 RepID=UPI0035ABE804
MSPAGHEPHSGSGGVGSGTSHGAMVAPNDDYQLAASTTSGGEKLKEMPDKYFMAIAHFLEGHVNNTDDMERFNGPILKSSIKSVYWLFLIQYAALALLGVILNIVIIVYIMYHRLYKDVTHAFIINLALCHFVQCALVLPVSLMVMLIQNWIFGQFLCFFLPMLQDIPLHVAMISHILIAWDRMRWLNDPLKGRLPGFVCCCATWLTGMVIALPYPIYTIYVELGDYMPQLAGIGLCVVNLMDDMHEYTRGLFLLMYCGPAILLSYLYIRTSQELRPPEGPFAVMMYEHRADLRMRQRNSSSASTEPRTTLSGGGVAGLSNGGGTSSRSYDLYSAELDVHREKRKQRNFGSMAATQVVCLCPLMILRFARLSLEETYENQKHFDLTYLMFVWVAFLPTVIFPCIYASQILPRDEQERLRGYFRLSSKRKQKNQRRSDAGTASSREDSIEKDEPTNTTSLPSENQKPGGGKISVAAPLSHDRGGYGHGGHNAGNDRYSGAPYRQGQAGSTGPVTATGTIGKERDRERDRQRGRGTADGTGVNNLGKDMRNKKHDVKINIISDGTSHGGHGGHSSGHGALRSKPCPSSSSNNSSRSKPNNAPTGQRERHRESISNSVSQITASTYCNGNSGQHLDDSSTSYCGDGEESSVLSGMPPQRWPASSLRHKDVSFSECSSTFSSSTLERDLEIIDLLERERSMDIQEMLQREREAEKVRPVGRQLPDIEKLYAQRSPKPKRESVYGYDKGSLALVMPGSDPLSMSSGSSSQPSTEYSMCSSLSQTGGGSQDRTMVTATVGAEDEEEVPTDFYDNYTPGGSQNLPPQVAAAAAATQVQGGAAATAAAAAPPAYQYQYTRRLSRKSSGSSSHHQMGGGAMSSRSSKRDSFNSLSGTDLIAGAFCELDPTQPLNKMAVIEGRMRRSSPRNSSFSSGSARSSMKSSSRDYGHGSTHSAHPELDFRENIFAEL